MVKNIVVAVDSSSAAKEALEWALENTVVDGDTVHLVHCYTPLKPTVGPHYAYVPTEKEQEDWRKQHAVVLEEFLMRVREKKPNAECHAHLVGGDPREQLAHIADKFDSACIVVGSRGHGAIKRALLGSVSTHLAHYSTRPVIIVHEKQVAAAAH